MDNKERKLSMRKLDTLIKVYAFTSHPSIVLNHKANITATSPAFLGLFFSYACYGALSAFIAFVTIHAFTPKQTFNERVYKILLAYEPLLQRQHDEFLQLINTGNATHDDLTKWMAGELKMLVEVPDGEAIAKAELLSKLK